MALIRRKIPVIRPISFLAKRAYFNLPATKTNQMIIEQQKRLSGAAILVLGMLPAMGWAQAANPTDKPGPVSSGPVNFGPVSYDKEAKTSYVASSDGHAIFVHLEVSDLGQQRKIVNNGVEVWIDAKGKKNKKVGLQYPLAESERSFTPPSMRDTGRAGMIHGIQGTLEKKKEFTAAGFAAAYNGKRAVAGDASADGGNPGMHVQISYRGDTLVYDAVIPLTAMAKPLAPHATVSIGIVEKGMLPPGMGEGGMSGEGGGPGGGPGGDGGGPGGGPGGGGPPPGGGGPGGMPDFEEMEAAFKENVIWVSVTLP